MKQQTQKQEPTVFYPDQEPKPFGQFIKESQNIFEDFMSRRIT